MTLAFSTTLNSHASLADFAQAVRVAFLVSMPGVLLTHMVGASLARSK
eukprot:CAMPEP_0204235004 /NCGR_PEP_ID=MMETSP0361-20130328/91367_1 /ASSEMBLY_ACC=CAM_ASM_000343 /TAXON_ID=268821 /ORGANISM="Scrippsiella Hangoei, Strain SHTV-5" /LENGTH=47 /DNA_ID= /DNA_START= /DNA_END= /DNA_ORIENTATION=